MRIEEKSAHHGFVWTVLQGLEDGERIMGTSLMERTAIKERRVLYQVIKDLREQGCLVGSSKHSSDRGYYEIRDENDLDRTLSTLRSSAQAMLDTAAMIERTFFERTSQEDEEENGE